MMKKILGIVGSPRRNGNTHILVSRMLEGAREKGAEEELVLLGEMKIKECDGCHACWKTRQCSKDDDMSALYAKIAESDVLVFGTPVYWYAPTALMKGFIDRFVYFNSPENRNSLRARAAVIAIPFEETDLKTAAPVVEFFEKCLAYLKIKLVARILVPGVTERGEILNKPEALQEAFEIGRNLL